MQKIASGQASVHIAVRPDPPLALIRLTNAAAQLPCGSGETQGKGGSLHCCLKSYLD
ncbi:MAG TPA: hypothetical protein VK140_00125 [Ktedonobacteraceae bacterium]|nr:hypothetical protein [Ktedonobacteraceae bacterium]